MAVEVEFGLEVEGLPEVWSSVVIFVWFLDFFKWIWDEIIEKRGVEWIDICYLRCGVEFIVVGFGIMFE